MGDNLTIKYDLAELPSSQHRAGLAGLVLMVRWIAGEPDKKGICEITQIDETTATFETDQVGLQFLFDKVYAASLEDQVRDKVKKNTKTNEDIPYKGTIEKSVLNEKTGELETKTSYIYPQVVPRGAFLADYDKSEKGVWIKLWRDMIWGILRGVPATRGPFVERSEGAYTDDADKVWKELNRRSDHSVDLPSTYFIGAQASNADNVPFKDLARYQLLLHFWAFVAQIYVPKEWKYDRKTNTEKPKDAGFALVIPDIADLETFCEEMPDLIRSRGNELFGYRPRECVVDVAAQGGLDLMNKLNQRLAAKVNRQISDLILGVDVVHLEKVGNNIRLWGSTRIDPVRPMIDKYARVKERFNNPPFRRQVILNVLNEKEWHFGFDRLFSTMDSGQTIGQAFFRSDVRKAFEDIGVGYGLKGADNMNSSVQEVVPKTIDEIVYRLVGTYISARLKSKYQLEWNAGHKGTAKEGEYGEKKAKLAREAFLAIRSRTGSDFIDYFASTLCSFPQFLNEEGYATLALALHSETEKVRTLTMLALSARG